MTTFIENAGAAIVSRKIVERTGNIKWLTRETPIAPPAGASYPTATLMNTCRIPRT